MTIACIRAFQLRVGPCPTVVGRSLRAAEGTTAGTDIRVGRPVVRQGRLSLSSSVSALSRTFRIADTAVDPLTNGFISESRVSGRQTTPGRIRSTRSRTTSSETTGGAWHGSDTKTHKSDTVTLTTRQTHSNCVEAEVHV